MDGFMLFLFLLEFVIDPPEEKGTMVEEEEDGTTNPYAVKKTLLPTRHKRIIATELLDTTIINPSCWYLSSFLGLDR